jgi:hypothetical protein
VVVCYHHVLKVELGCPAANGKGAIRNLNDPEEAGRADARVKVVNLVPRTGVKEVNSYFDKGAAVVRTIQRDVLTLVHAYVSLQMVCSASGICCRTCEDCHGDKAAEVGEPIRFYILSFEKGVDAYRPWHKLMDDPESRDEIAARDWNRLGISMLRRWLDGAGGRSKEGDANQGHCY